MNLTVMQDGSELLHYDNPMIPIYVRRGDLISLSNMSALCHWHDDIELLLPIKGYLSYNVNGAHVKIEQGDAIFVNARQMHYGFSADGTDCEYLCVTFRPQLLCANEEVQNRFILPILTSPHFTHLVLRRSNPEHKPLLATLEQLDLIYRSRREGFELQAMSLMFGFWHGLFLLTKDQLSDAASSDANMLIQRRMLEYIRTHYPEKLTLNSIAAAGGVCRTRCCQLFKKYLGRTPNDYLNSFRLETSMYLLKSTQMSITEIAVACGFGSASYFSEMFARMKGCPPTHYRRQ